MTTPERPIFTPEQVYQNYLDGLIDENGTIREFDYILSLKTGTTFEEFLESLAHVHKMSPNDELNISDPEWYERDNYKAGILHPKLYEKLVGFLREQEHGFDGKILEENQVLGPICHYSDQQFSLYSEPGRRTNLLIEVSGGKKHDLGEYIWCSIEKDFDQFEFQEDAQTISEMKQLGRQTGRPEIYYYRERQKRKKDS